MDVCDVHHVRDLSNHLQFLGLPAVLQVVLELERDVEVVDNGTLISARYHNDLVDAGGHRLLYPVLDDGLVDDRQHFFRLRFGGRQKTSPKPSRRKNGLANSAHISSCARWTGCRAVRHQNIVLPLLLSLGVLAKRELDPLHAGVVDHHLGRSRLLLASPHPGTLLRGEVLVHQLMVGLGDGRTLGLGIGECAGVGLG